MAEGDDDRDQSHSRRNRRAGQRAEDREQNDHRGREAELKLACPEVLLGDLLEVTSDGELAEHVDSEAPGSVDPFDDLDDRLDAVLLVLGQDHSEDRGVAVPRYQHLAAAAEVGGDFFDGPAAT
jgi:hypothetical protein